VLAGSRGPRHRGLGQRDSYHRDSVVLPVALLATRQDSTEDAVLSNRTEVRISVGQAHSVSGLLQLPARAIACYVMGHGAGGGMTHSFMSAVADGLCQRRIATLRYQFPYMERGSKRPDRPALAHATVRAAVSATVSLAPSLPLFAGGKSFGGRMTSQAQAEAPLPDVRGLIFLGFPLHSANKPSDDRAQHLSRVHIPMLFLQGNRDPLADMRLLVATVRSLGKRATLTPIDGADHSFHIAARSGRTDAQVLAQVLDALAGWIEGRDVC
jgi:predicted alpha/beta-hydrolase family hydrolase